MKTLQLYDPPMCCSTGVCGPDIDPVLPAVAAWLQGLQAAGVRVERYNLAHQPQAYVQNPRVKALLDAGGTEALPALFIDGELKFQGRYPDAAERASLPAAGVP